MNTFESFPPNAYADMQKLETTQTSSFNSADEARLRVKSQVHVLNL